MSQFSIYRLNSVIKFPILRLKFLPGLIHLPSWNVLLPDEANFQKISWITYQNSDSTDP